MKCDEHPFAWAGESCIKCMKELGVPVIRDKIQAIWPHVQARHEPEGAAAERIMELLALKERDLYREDMSAINKEIYRLYRECEPIEQEPECDPHPKTALSIKLDDTQATFVHSLGRGVMARGVRICIDMARTAKKLPDLPDELNGP